LEGGETALSYTVPTNGENRSLLLQKTDGTTVDFTSQHIAESSRVIDIKGVVANEHFIIFSDIGFQSTLSIFDRRSGQEISLEQLSIAPEESATIRVYALGKNSISFLRHISSGSNENISEHLFTYDLSDPQQPRVTSDVNLFGYDSKRYNDTIALINNSVTTGTMIFDNDMNKVYEGSFASNVIYDGCLLVSKSSGDWVLVPLDGTSRGSEIKLEIDQAFRELKILVIPNLGAFVIGEQMVLDLEDATAHFTVKVGKLEGNSVRWTQSFPDMRFLGQYAADSIFLASQSQVDARGSALQYQLAPAPGSIESARLELTPINDGIMVQYDYLFVNSGVLAIRTERSNGQSELIITSPTGQEQRFSNAMLTQVDSAHRFAVFDQGGNQFVITQNGVVKVIGDIVRIYAVDHLGTIDSSKLTGLQFVVDKKGKLEVETIVFNLTPNQ
jgi:hypothetical protein